MGNLSLSISLEGFEEVNDFRRGNGVFDKVMHAMDLLKQSGQIFGTSICYTSKNIDTVTSDEFLDLIIEKGCRFTWYFHYMPVGNDAAPELLPTKEQREYMYHRIREIRAMEGGKPIYAMDFQNDGEFVGGCIDVYKRQQAGFGQMPTLPGSKGKIPGYAECLRNCPAYQGIRPEVLREWKWPYNAESFGYAEPAAARKTAPGYTTGRIWGIAGTARLAYG